VSPSSEPTQPQAPPFDVGLVVIDSQMAIILVHVGKNIVEDVLLNGGLGVNIITEDLRETLGLPISKLAPYTLRMAD
jgi:hypothetical protein